MADASLRYRPEVARAIVDKLTADGPLSILVLAEALDLLPTTAASHVGTLAGKGILVREDAPAPRWSGDSVYRISSSTNTNTKKGSPR